MSTPVLETRDLLDAFWCHQNAAGPAIIGNGRHLSYPELAARVRSAAHALGPDPGVVGVFAARTPQTVVALLATLAAGGVYCPLDPDFPEPRRQRMIAAAGCATVVLTEPGQTPPDGVRVVDLTRQLPAPAAAAEADPAVDADPVVGVDPAVAVDPRQPAYLLFTSGSTGSPKPVLTPRGAISTVVPALAELFGLTGADRVLQFASLNWDTCFEEILPTLTTGATLVVDGEARTGSLPRVLRMVAQRGVTILNLPTAYWHELVRHLRESGDRLPDCVRLVVIGGEAVSPARLTDWRELDTGQVRLLNTYGCTETTLITHAAELRPDDRPDQIPIGRALPHVAERIGEDGELLIGGPALALGYLGAPQATAKSFVTVDGGRFFRTGDRVRRAADGQLRHLGRLDNQLKVRGVRVDPGEVEALLSEHPDVRAAAVVGDTVAGRTVLIGYLVPGPAADPARLAARTAAWLADRAPAHLRPSRLTVVSQLARTASGKVDRAATHRRHAPGASDRRRVPGKAGRDDSGS